MDSTKLHLKTIRDDIEVGRFEEALGYAEEIVKDHQKLSGSQTEAQVTPTTSCSPNVGNRMPKSLPLTSHTYGVSVIK